MQTVHRNTDIVTIPRQYRNRPNPQTVDKTNAEPLSDAIYLVGGDPCLREQISTCLSTAGRNVIGFLSARQYLGFESKDAAACVIIDSNLPDMCGLECDLLDETAHMPAADTHGFAHAQRRECFRAGFLAGGVTIRTAGRLLRAAFPSVWALVPHMPSPHGAARIWTVLLVFFHTPAQGGGVDCGAAAAAIVIGNANAALARIRGRIDRILHSKRPRSP